MTEHEQFERHTGILIDGPHVGLRFIGTAPEIFVGDKGEHPSILSSREDFSIHFIGNVSRYVETAVCSRRYRHDPDFKMPHYPL